MPQIPESANKGLENVIACTTEISTIQDVTLLFRGYTIEDLAAHCGFEEIIYLLWNGKLPNRSELDQFQKELEKYSNLPEEFLSVLASIAKVDSHPMSKLRTAISYFGMYDKNAEDISLNAVQSKGLRLTAAMGTIVSALSRFEQNQKPVAPIPGKSLAWNFLNMMRNHQPDDEEAKLFNTALVLHADHELNASSFTARAVVSANSDYYSAITAAVGTLKGPLHGGANEQVMLMLKEIGSFNKVDAFIADALQSKKKVMGIGHRVYKHGDPRAKILKELSIQTCNKAGLGEYHKMLAHIEEQMESKKGLMPNVDFYSGLVYTALGLRSRDFTPIFATSRIAGWTAQVLEQYGHNRIYRPRGFYVGPTHLQYKPIEQR